MDEWGELCPVCEADDAECNWCDGIGTVAHECAPSPEMAWREVEPTPSGWVYTQKSNRTSPPGKGPKPADNWLPQRGYRGGSA